MLTELHHLPDLLGSAIASTFVTCFIALCFTLAVGPLFGNLEPARGLCVPHVPTPQAVIDRMLDLAQVRENDVLVDLGCGEGGIVITAAQQRGAHGVGVDLNPRRIAAANANAHSAGVTEKVRFTVADLFKSDVRDASVVTLYLLPGINRKLRPLLWRQLRPGARVVSHDFDMGPEWPAEKVEKIDDNKFLYLWTITDAHKKAAAGYSRPI